MKKLVSLLEDPPREDSKDLTPEEVQEALHTSSAEDLAGSVKRQVLPGECLHSHELRRMGDHMYCRVRLGAKDAPSRSILFQIDWVVNS